MDITSKLSNITLSTSFPYVSVPVIDQDNNVIGYKRISLEEYMESYKK